MGVPRTAKHYAPLDAATGIVDDIIVNADINSAAAIAFSKLAALADGKILVGSAANVATAVTPSGHVAVTNAGVVSVLGGAAAAAADFTVTAVATKDIAMKLGDAAGVSMFKVKDSAASVLFQVDSLGAVTMVTGAALNVDTIDAIATKDMTFTSGGSGKDFIFALNAGNVNDKFYVKQGANVLFNVGGTGLVTLLNGAELDNISDANVLKITEATVQVAGALNVTGQQTLTGKTTAVAGVVGKYATHTGVAIADLTAAIGDPSTLGDGFTATYKNSTDAKVYHVAVVGGAFYIHELTAASA